MQLPSPRRSGPHVRHGLRATDPQNHRTNPAGPSDSHVLGNVAKRGSQASRGLHLELRAHLHRHHRAHGQPEHPSARRGRRRRAEGAASATSARRDHERARLEGHRVRRDQAPRRRHLGVHQEARLLLSHHSRRQEAAGT